MKTLRWGPLQVHLHGGATGSDALVLLHGFGAPGHDLAGLAGVLGAPPTVRLIFPEALIELGPAYAGGRAWWNIDLARRIAEREAGKGVLHRREVPVGLIEAARAVEGLLDAIVPAPTRLVLGGFSQGAMLSAHIALTTARPLAGLVLLSGAVIAEEQWTERAAGTARQGLRVFQSHGMDDPILEYGGAEALRSLLVAARAEVEFHPFRGGHTIPPPVLRSLAAYLRGIFPPPP